MNLTAPRLGALRASLLLLAAAPGCGKGNHAAPQGVAANVGPSKFPCKSPAPVQIDGKPTGFESCDGRWQHRAAAVDCPPAPPRPQPCGRAGAGGCASDADCSQKPNGHCESHGPEAAACFCRYGCVRDQDCQAGEICECGSPSGRCVKASCKSDADCGGGLCARYDENPHCGDMRYACQSKDDQCSGEADCGSHKACVLVGGHRVCREGECAIGRPLLVGGAPRLAPLAPFAWA